METYNPSEFDAIRPFDDGEVQAALRELLADRQFQTLLRAFVPWMPRALRTAALRTAALGVKTTLGFQLRFMLPIVHFVLRRCSTSHTFAHPHIQPGPERYTFISNHRDIVLDSAILDVMLHEDKFPTTCEIAIGDNLFIRPWIKTLVRMNKAFTVRRGLTGAHELMESSRLMSRYMHYAITEKRENIWIAQREGRAKDSSDHTQESVLKMLAMGGEGSAVDRLRELNIVPLTISYELDPCDYLKASEFQLKRDNPAYKKTKKDDLDNMRTGIMGQKGHIHYEAAAPINTWIDELRDTPRADFFAAVAQRVDREIHRGYRLFPANYVAADLLTGHYAHVHDYTHQDKVAFERYLRSRLDLIDLPERDEAFLRERMLTMYANPVMNKEKACE